ncbi:MAG: D-alanyl-D-alanine carboxypeptidase family protein [Bacillota bacterium]|jgi:D-alanyl-D-alanine carboxypeptidase (penicillin-binding protein 5/6)|nr:D-alanyl-D-alanine carboxypeptidase [Bacillota bacterium]HOB91689.1 D-alanyl-D-alanine carboxypeptidase family protein [Bacillota bacterium]HPZ54557.1 D-alanyl-D-alanine carboxypeptidase family protein [Bacillota bacterium]HQD18355.1 D-alanyl-D-alanine carboxypeptidase family protein [Bacillota bacterium]
MRKGALTALLTAIMVVTTSLGISLAQGDTPFDPTYILIDTVSGQVLAEDGAHVRRAPASVTKVMTMLVAMEAIEQGKGSLDDIVRVSKKAAGIGGSQIYLAEGERISLEDLMKAIAIASANDACVAVAEHLAGTEEVFVTLMNKEAERLGLKDTRFTNTNGLPEDGHYSSAYDLAIMTRELVLRYPSVLDWTSKRYTTIRDGKTTIYNTNKLLGQLDGLTGMKTGHTQNAGYCLSATASRGDEHRIAVVMGYQSDDSRWQKARELVEYGFKAFDRLNPASEGDVVGKVEVKDGVSLTVDAVAAGDLTFLVEVTKRDQVSTRIIQEEVQAPIEKGTVVGRFVAFVGENEANSVPVYAAEDVPKAAVHVRIWRSVVNFVKGLFSS